MQLKTNYDSFKIYIHIFPDIWHVICKLTCGATKGAYYMVLHSKLYQYGTIAVSYTHVMLTWYGTTIVYYIAAMLTQYNTTIVYCISAMLTQNDTTIVYYILAIPSYCVMYLNNGWCLP